jgi:hypothetical protein
MNFSSHATYSHCATGAQYPEYRKSPHVRDELDPDDQVGFNSNSNSSKMAGS